MKLHAMHDEWISVYHGTPSVAALIAGELADNGIAAYAPDMNMKVLDPLDVGGMVFEARVLVARENAERALEIVASAREGAAPPVGDDVDPRVRQLASLGRRIRWSAALWIFAPYALWLACRYFPAVREARVEIPYHRITVLATGFAVFQTAALLLALVMGFGGLMP